MTGVGCNRHVHPHDVVLGGFQVVRRHLAAGEPVKEELLARFVFLEVHRDDAGRHLQVGQMVDLIAGFLVPLADLHVLQAFLAVLFANFLEGCISSVGLMSCLTGPFRFCGLNGDLSLEHFDVMEPMVRDVRPVLENREQTVNLIRGRHTVDPRTLHMRLAEFFHQLRRVFRVRAGHREVSRKSEGSPDASFDNLVNGCLALRQGCGDAVSLGGGAAGADNVVGGVSRRDGCCDCLHYVFTVGSSLCFDG